MVYRCQLLVFVVLHICCEYRKEAMPVPNRFPLSKISFIPGLGIQVLRRLELAAQSRDGSWVGVLSRGSMQMSFAVSRVRLSSLQLTIGLRTGILSGDFSHLSQLCVPSAELHVRQDSQKASGCIRHLYTSRSSFIRSRVTKISS